MKQLNLIKKLRLIEYDFNNNNKEIFIRIEPTYFYD